MTTVKYTLLSSSPSQFTPPLPSLFSNEDILLLKSTSTGLKIQMTTARLEIRSIQLEDIAECIELYQNPIVISKMGIGQPKQTSNIEDQIKKKWLKKWEENNPYSALTILDSQTGSFVGQFALGENPVPGEINFICLLKPEYWNCGYGTETLNAVLQIYLPTVVSKGYLSQGIRPRRLTASVNSDNLRGIKFVEKAGMRLENQNNINGIPRLIYELPLEL